MAEKIQRVVETTTDLGDTVQRTSEVQNVSTETGQTQLLMARIVWFVAGALLVLLGFRFILSLLGANTSNGFAQFVYNASHPFVAPFFGLFNYQDTFGVSHLEIYTLVAMAVYAVLAWGITKLITLNR